MIRAIALPVVMLLLFGCARAPGKQQAELNYQAIERVNSNSYVITYTSNMDLLNVFDRSKGEGQLETLLVCSLDGDPDFSVDHVIENTFTGVIHAREAPPAPPFLFKTIGILSFNYDDGGSSRILNSKELSTLLRKRSEVACVVSITVFGYKAYYSRPMHIPTADFIKEVEKTPHIWPKGAGNEYLPPELRN